ncbi:MAG: cellulose synthase family protein [Anaerolineae bacterium]
MIVLGILYFIAALCVALFGGNALLLAVLYLRRRSFHPSLPPEPETWPAVTVQLPVYNELYVVKRLLDAAARLDYPRERLQIQVLDDSTDETTRLIQARVAHYRAQGLDIELVHRPNRQGFKAGALAHGLKRARGEFVAIFDADFVPPNDFLKRTIPYLIAQPRLAFVQTRWGYLNTDYSALTHAQTIALDGHFVVEHLARNRNGLLINFNGTAGVWRRTAIETAGGWQSDTLTEDVDLSFRAQLAGWQALYLPEVVAPAELPPQMAAFKQQQARWATGAAQCLVKLAGSLWKGKLHPPVTDLPWQEKDGVEALSFSLPWPVRLEGLLHLSIWIAHPMSLLLLVLTPLMLLNQTVLTLNVGIFWLMTLGPIFAYALSQQHLYPDWKRRMWYMPVLALLGTGLALSNTWAIGQGLLMRNRVFQRTPKFRIVSRGDRWIHSRYVLPFQWISLGELALAGLALISAIISIAMSNYFAVPFLLLYAGGYGYVGFHGIKDGWMGRHKRPRLSRPVTVSSR